MHQFFLDLNRNILQLQTKLTAILKKVVDENFRRVAEQLFSKMSQFLFDVTGAIEKLKMGKVTDLVMDFLDEVEAFLLDFYYRFSFKNEAILADGTQAVVAALRQQVVFLDQQRQTFFVFS